MFALLAFFSNVSCKILRHLEKKTVLVISASVCCFIQKRKMSCTNELDLKILTTPSVNITVRLLIFLVNDCFKISFISCKLVASRLLYDIRKTFEILHSCFCEYPLKVGCTNSLSHLSYVVYTFLYTFTSTVFPNCPFHIELPLVS